MPPIPLAKVSRKTFRRCMDFERAVSGRYAQKAEIAKSGTVVRVRDVIGPVLPQMLNASKNGY